MTDFNNDGKVNSEDYYLYSQMSDNNSRKPVYRGKSRMIVPGLLAIAYLSFFLKGSLGFGIFRLLLAIICALIIFAWIFGD